MTRLPIAALAALATLSSLAATPAVSLSCMRPDVARAFAQADAAEETYIVARATLSFDEALLPQTDWENQAATPPHTLIPARLEGQALTKEGFTTPFAQEITLDAQCFGPWCSGAESGTEFLVFLEKRAEGYLFPLDPCGTMAFPEPTAAQGARVLQCLRGAGCEPLN
ncbi:MAG: hypothetical protein RIG84_10590 [Roseovarius sp.]